MKLRKYSVQLKSFLFFVSIILQSQTLIFAQDSLSCLFIGNSYVQYNNLPNLVASIATSKGKTLTIGTKANGGFTFTNHANDPATYTAIANEKWDYVVIQGQSQEPSFPYSQVNSQSLPAAVRLADSVYMNWYCSQAMYFMTWGRQNGDPQWDSINTFDKMNLRLRNAYMRIADSAQASVSPVGVAWKWVRDTYPTINLYSSDGSHPSPEGSYLAACTFYASLFRLPSSGAVALMGIDALTAQRLQQAADLAVLDSLNQWHLRPTAELSIADFSYTVNGNTVDFSNESWCSTDYFWSFGDGFSSTLENPQHTYSSPDFYIVSLSASSFCSEDTLVQQITLAGAGIEEHLTESLKIAHISDGYYRFTLLSGHSFEFLTAVDMSGREVKPYIESEKAQIGLDFSGRGAGMYILIFLVNGKEISTKIQVD